ncbi:hypothetical protein B0H19DRAFT_1252273 [Mycena capillaripes]|nr:hypothetical protein B0H19DRAFT_1252273 [Mycena capillaripes]
MSASSKKDRVFTLGVYRGPPQLSQKELTSRVDALVDNFLALPVAQKNFLKFTMMVPNDALNEDVAMLGVGLPPPSVFLFGQYAVLRDEEFTRTLDAGKGFVHDSSWSFSADVKTFIEKPTPVIIGADAHCCGALLLKAPRDIAEQLQGNLEAAIEKYTTLPVVQRNLLRCTYWQPNSMIADELLRLGHPIPETESILLLMFEAETLAHLVEASSAMCDTPYNATVCTDCGIAQLAACADCDDQIGQGDEPFAQEAISGFVTGCNGAGFSVKNVTVSGAYAAAGGNFQNSNFNFPACGADGKATSIGASGGPAGDSSSTSGAAAPSQSQAKSNGGNARAAGIPLSCLGAMLAG